jgi:hypothetical protein
VNAVNVSFCDEYFLDLEVSFNFSTECDYPQLPSWLYLEQRRASAPAFLYGAPGNWDESTKIEVRILFYLHFCCLNNVSPQPHAQRLLKV